MYLASDVVPSLAGVNESPLRVAFDSFASIRGRASIARSEEEEARAGSRRATELERILLIPRVLGGCRYRYTGKILRPDTKAISGL